MNNDAITITHNFEETKFKWLWAKYVKAGNKSKHCTACLIGKYSKRFSGTSNHNLLGQRVLIMDEIPENQYEAIYFCGVLKSGYTSKHPEKNNYRHNVHFAIIPQKGTIDKWTFENWQVSVINGKFERIPESYELKDKFFQSPYNAHYYTCRIFRWMLGHFYPDELISGIISESKVNLPFAKVNSLIDLGKMLAEDNFNVKSPYFIKENDKLRSSGIQISIDRTKEYLLSHKIFSKEDFIEFVKILGLKKIASEKNEFMSYADSSLLSINDKSRLITIGINSFLEMFFPYD